MKRAAILTTLLGLLASAFAAEAQTRRERGPTFRVDYEITIVPTERRAHVTINLGSGARHLKELRFRTDDEVHADWKGSGEIERSDGRVIWRPPEAGGALRYTARIDHLRDERSYDARCTDTWALFRGGDLVPPATARMSAGARARSRLRFRLPQGWSIATPYARSSNGAYVVEHPHRAFDRPTGWMIAGDLGVVREDVAGMKLAIAGPTGQGLHRLDILSLLRWTAPSLAQILGKLPERLLIVGAGDPMWRGGLSGPGSLYVHASRPLISEDGTSPLLHEWMHTVLRISGGEDGDWLVEGLAEYYSLQLLIRSGTISADRAERAFERLARKAKKAKKLRTRRATSAVTARAVGVLRDLDGEIRFATDGVRSLDDVFRSLSGRPGEEIDTARFRAVAEEIAGRDLAAFFQSRVR